MAGVPWEQQFTIRLQSLSSGSVALTHVFSTKDLDSLLSVPLSVTTGGSATVFTDTKLGTTNTYLGRIVEFISCTNAQLNGLRRVITGYVVASSQATFSEALPANMTAGDTYKILSPVPRSCGRVGIAAISAANATGNIGAANSAVVKAVNVGGAEYAVSALAGNASSAFETCQFSTPPLLMMRDGNMTVTVTSGAAWSVVTDYYVTFVAT